MVEIDAEALYDLTRPASVAVSPDGSRVAYLTSESDPEEDERVNSLWVAPTDGSSPPHRLTRASDASSPTWSPDGTKLGFLAARDRDPDLRTGRDEETDDDSEPESSEDSEDEPADDDTEEGGDNGSESQEMQVWAFDMERGGDARQVTDLDESVQEFDWGPNGERVVVAARDPTDDEQESLDEREDGGPIEVERLQHKYDGKGFLDEVTTYLFVVDVDTRAHERLDDANDGGYGAGGSLSPQWGQAGRIAFSANHTENPDDNYVADIYTIQPDGTDRQKVTESELSASTPRWSPDGERLAFLGRDPENLYVPMEVYITDGDEGYESRSGALDRTIGYGGAHRWVDNETLLVTIGDGGRTRFARVHTEEPPERALDEQDRLETLAGFDIGDSTVAVLSSRPDDGQTLDTIDATAIVGGQRGADELTRITAFNAEFVDSHPTPECQRLTFEGANGDTVEGLAFYPDDFDPENPDARGLVLNIHGGPMAYDTPAFRFQDAFFTSRGYIVFKVNYHGSTSYGSAFCESLRGNWGTLEVEDLLAGVDTLVDRGWADPDRLFPTGFSQGGVNTGYLVTQDNRWTAAAAEHGIYDMRSCYGTDDSHVWWDADYGLPWENPEEYEDASSITDVDNVETPLLVTAGENDWRCPPSQSEQLYVSVRKQGVDAKLVIYQNEHHNIGDPDRAIHRLETLDEWFATYDPERESPEDSETASEE